MPLNSTAAAIVRSSIPVLLSNLPSPTAMPLYEEVTRESTRETVNIWSQAVCFTQQKANAMLKHPLFLIIDGMSQAYRAYFAIRDALSNSQGLPTNAIYGFAIMLRRVLDKYPPDYICVAFDSSQQTARHAQYELYKATRKKMPADLAQQ